MCIYSPYKEERKGFVAEGPRVHLDQNRAVLLVHLMHVDLSGLTWYPGMHEVTAKSGRQC